MRRHFLAFLALTVLWGGGGAVSAAELPRAVESPLAGITFDDPPIALPGAKNFQVALQTAAQELGLSCRTIESYGWRMQQSEQARVETIFSATVRRLRALGYQVEARHMDSVAPDVTVFTAYRPDKELLAMWSAGELGLVLLMCDAPPNPAHGSHVGFMAPKQKAGGGRNSPMASTRTSGNFTPLGVWQGTFTCARGISGGTLKITSVVGRRAEGVFQFYPTRGSIDIPSGGYIVSGSYDPQSHRVQLKPGNWIKRPRDFEAAPISGNFDPAQGRFSGVFIDVAGCTSFEGRRSSKMPSEVRKTSSVKTSPVKAAKPRKEDTAAPVAASQQDKAAPEVKGTTPEPLPPVNPEPPADVAPTVTAPASAPKVEAIVPPVRANALAPPESLDAPPPLLEKPRTASPPVPMIDAPPMPAPPEHLPDPPVQK